MRALLGVFLSGLALNLLLGADPQAVDYVPAWLPVVNLWLARLVALIALAERAYKLNAED
jgi:hypothetical protein